MGPTMRAVVVARYGGRLTPVIGAHYPLERIEDAVEQLERGDLIDRIVLMREG